MIETYYRLQIHDREGVLVRDSGEVPSHSYVIQFLEMVEGWVNDENKIATDVDNAETRIAWDTGFDDFSGDINAVAGDDNHGIVVGTNTGPTAEDNLNYKLDTKILHSAVGAAGKLNYQAMTWVAPRTVGLNIDLDISRTFLNETGGTITIKEIGIITWGYEDYYHLILRDVVEDEAVDDAETLTVVYTLRTIV